MKSCFVSVQDADSIIPTLSAGQKLQFARTVSLWWVTESTYKKKQKKKGGEGE